jgi:hypothetical protein
MRPNVSFLFDRDELINLNIKNVYHPSNTPLNNTDDRMKLYGENFALRLLEDYVNMDDESFSCRYADLYWSLCTSSSEHKRSLQRLLNDDDKKTHAYFYGEVISALLAPLLATGV